MASDIKYKYPPKIRKMRMIVSHNDTDRIQEKPRRLEMPIWQIPEKKPLKKL